MALPALIPLVARLGAPLLRGGAGGALRRFGVPTALGFGGAALGDIILDGDGDGAGAFRRRRRRRAALTSSDLRMMHEISNAISKKAAETFIAQRVRRG